MLGLTPTIVGMMDNINRTYGLPDNIPVEQTINFALDLDTPVHTGTRQVCAYMYGSDGRDSRSAGRSFPYAPLPLIARPLSSPLTSIERANYFLRKVVTISGVDYEVYYAGRLNTPSAMSMVKYLSYASPTDTHLTQALTLPAHYYDWTNILTSESIIRLASSVTIPFRSADSASLLAACALLGITITDVREVAVVSGIEYTESAGVTELSNAIGVNHSSLDGPLTAPGLELNLGVLTGVML